MPPERAINWLESTRRSLQASVPETSEAAPYLTERLSALLLQRLPPELVGEILSLLPDDSEHALDRGRDQTPEYSIGYTTFVENVRHLLGLTDILDASPYAESETSYAELCDRVAEAFLWAVAQEFPVELKSQVADHLPTELRCRMNLNSGFSGAEKVA